jgi:hypothetical protein
MMIVFILVGHWEFWQKLKSVVYEGWRQGWEWVREQEVSAKLAKCVGEGHRILATLRKPENCG